MSDFFPILSIETSDELCSVALLLDEDKYFEHSIKQKHIHSKKLVPMIDGILKEAGLSTRDIKVIAVSEGPGSFTGLRIGMAAAKGIALGAKAKFLAVPTIDAVANKIASYVPAHQKFCIVKKANKDEAYFARFEATESDIEIKISICLLQNENIESQVEEGDMVFGYSDARIIQSDLTTPSALDIGRWAYKFGKDLVTSDYNLIEPKYLKNFVVKEKK